MQQENGKTKHSKKNGEIEDDLISLFVFGEDEDDLLSEADQNGGVIHYDKVKHHHHKDMPLMRAHTFADVSCFIIDSVLKPSLLSFQCCVVVVVAAVVVFMVE